jgi:hypothetical protein
LLFVCPEVLAQLQQGLKHLLGALLRQAMQETMEQDVRFLVGKRNQP